MPLVTCIVRRTPLYTRRAGKVLIQNEHLHSSRHTRHHRSCTMSIADESGQVFKAELKAGKPKMGLFLNSGSPTIAEQLSCAGYDWLLVDAQHGPMNPET